MKRAGGTRFNPAAIKLAKPIPACSLAAPIHANNPAATPTTTTIGRLVDTRSASHFDRARGRTKKCSRYPSASSARRDDTCPMAQNEISTATIKKDNPRYDLAPTSCTPSLRKTFSMLGVPASEVPACFATKPSSSAISATATPQAAAVPLPRRIANPTGPDNHLVCDGAADESDKMLVPRSRP